MDGENILDADVSLLLETIHNKYGHDFRQYSKTHIKRRVFHRMALSGIRDIKSMQKSVLEDEILAYQFLQDLSITFTEMFRDPGFYRSLRENIIPRLKTYPFINIWHAGCSTGEEVYSMAIILKEEGLYDKTTIYATDFNQYALNQAKTGVYLNNLMYGYSANYQLSGGKEPFANYYSTNYNMAILDPKLKRNIVWAHHNLVSDAVFVEAHLILCRNVMIYFGKELKNHAVKLFYDSLITGGILCLGASESLRFSIPSRDYMEIDPKQKIYKKK